MIDEGEHQHQWRETRVTVIQRDCECGAQERAENRAGRLLGYRNAARGTSKPGKAARNLEWKRLYEGGATQTAIARQYGLTPGAVAGVLRRMGVPLRPHSYGSWARGPRSQERAIEIVRLCREEHLSFSEIGHRFGITRERVRQILRQSGVDLHAADEERRHLTAKKYQPKPPSICKFCGEDFTSEGWTAHQRRLKHNPSPHAAEYAVRNRAIAADYAAGLKFREIKERYHVDATVISRAAKRHGIPMRRKTFNRLPTIGASLDRKAQIVIDRRNGLTPAEIAAKHGVSRAWVYMASRAS